MILTRALLNAHDNVTIHLKKAAVAVVSKALVFTAFGQSADGSIVEAKVEDGVHHSRHGVTSPRADSDEQGILLIAEFLAHGGLEFVDGLVDLFFKGRWVGAFMVVVVGTDLCADGESGGDREPDSGHFCQVGAFTPQEGFHCAIPIGFAVPEGVNVFWCLTRGLFCFGGFRFRGHE